MTLKSYNLYLDMHVLYTFKLKWKLSFRKLVIEVIYLLAYSRSTLVDKKMGTSLGGLEPPTFRLTAERANRLRHRDHEEFAPYLQLLF